MSTAGYVKLLLPALPDLQDAKTGNADSLALLEMLSNKADEIAKEGFTGPFCQLMLLGQDRRKMLKRHGTAALGRCGLFVSFRHDGPPRSVKLLCQQDMIRTKK